MTAVRWLILLFNLGLIAGIGGLAYYFNFKDVDSVPGADFYIKKAPPYRFKAEAFLPKKQALPRQKNWDPIWKATQVTHKTPEPVENTADTDDSGEFSALTKLVSEVHAVVYYSGEPENSGCYIKIGNDLMYFQVGDQLEYGEAEKVVKHGFWLDKITENREAETYEIYFRDQKGRSKKLFDYSTPKPKDILIEKRG